MGEPLENLNDKIYNSRIFVAYIRYLRDNHPHVDIDELLRFSDIDPSSIDDPLEWYSQAQADRFIEYLSNIFDDSLSIAREAGHYVYSDKILGLFKQFSLKLLGVGYVYKNIAKYASALTRTSEYSSRELAPNKYEVTVTFNSWVKETPQQEYNRLGILEAAPLMFSQKMAKVESERNGNTIRYTIKWSAPKSELIDKYRTCFLIVSIIAIFLILYNQLFNNYFFVFFIVGIVLLAFMFLTIIKEKYKYKELNSYFQIHEESAEQIIQTYIDDYKQVDVLNRIGRIILSEGSESNYLTGIAETLIGLNYKKVSFFISDFNTNKIVNKYNHGYGGPIDRVSFERSDLKEHKNFSFTTVVLDQNSLPSTLPFFSEFTFDDSDFPLIFVPIIYGESPLGFFFVTPENSLLPISKKKNKFLMGVASQISLGIHKQNSFYEIAESDRIKTEFIATASHELKTPVQTIMSGLSELEFTKDVEANLPLLKTVAGKMAQQISNLLSLHRIESKKYSLDITSVKLSDILDKIKDSAFAIASVYSHSVVFKGFDSKDNSLSVDFERLCSAIINLINNSCKYTPPEGKIIIQYSKSHSEHRISVIDNGIGIPLKYQDKIFIKFYQVPSHKRISTGGIGLGLSIVKEIVSLHNGDITVLSPLPLHQYDISLGEERVGTKITINLPIL